MTPKGEIGTNIEGSATNSRDFFRFFLVLIAEKVFALATYSVLRVVNNEAPDFDLSLRTTSYCGDTAAYGRR